MRFFKVASAVGLTAASIISAFAAVHTYQDRSGNNDYEHLALAGGEAFACVITGIRGLIDLIKGCCEPRDNRDEEEGYIPPQQNPYQQLEEQYQPSAPPHR